MLRVVIKDVARVFLGTLSSKRNALIRLMNISRESGYLRLAKFFSRRLNSEGLFISHTAKIAGSVRFKHPIAIVIGEGVVINHGVTIYQSVTIGAVRIGDAKIGAYPTIGQNSVVFAGAVIVGKIRIGENCIVGANSVVLNDIPDNSVCAGAPAKVVRQNVSPSNGDTR